MEAYLRYTHQYTPTSRSSSTSTPANMSTVTLADLKYITNDNLAQQILSSPSGKLPDGIAVVDVRDSDHVGGHIAGSTWVPSNELDYKTPELVRTLRQKELVVFHCALSQQRGPSAALRYLREKQRLDPKSKTASKGEVEEGKEGKGGEEQKDEEADEKVQQVLVLDGGFTKWQEKYGEDKRLTEAYRKDIWEFGY
jgi:rhodanese-related sulfurtransferase